MPYVKTGGRGRGGGRGKAHRHVQPEDRVAWDIARLSYFPLNC